MEQSEEARGPLEKKVKRKGTRKTMPRPLLDKTPAELEQEQARAKAAAEAMRRKKQAQAEEAAEEETMYYVKCPRCLAPGIWLGTEKPVGAIPPERWFSAYKPPGVGWPSSHVRCQCCDADLQVTVYSNDRFGIEGNYRRRFLGQMPYRQYMALLSGSEETEQAEQEQEVSQ